MSVTDNRGHFTAEPTAAVIDVASASSLLQKQISATAHAPTIVRCGSLPVLVVAPGTSFACTAKVGSQASRALTVTVEDLQGNVRFDLAPAAPAPIRGRDPDRVSAPPGAEQGRRGLQVGLALAVAVLIWPMKNPSACPRPRRSASHSVGVRG